jgi:hypothetical protein
MLASLPLFLLQAGPKALRIDVEQKPEDLLAELDTLYGRLHRPGDALCGLATLDIDYPGLVFRYRVADGEHYVYAEDSLRRRLAGYTVFNRLVELDRQADRHLRAPHSKYAPGYQRRGIARAVYRWWLDGGRGLITGARQSTGAHALWTSLARHYGLIYVDLRGKVLRYLGTDIHAQVLDRLHTRMILLPQGMDTGMLAELAGLQDVRADGMQFHHGRASCSCCRR